MDQLPEKVTSGEVVGPQFFALVNAYDPDSVYYYGIDVGNGAFTVRRDPNSHETNFGSWSSMRSAYRMLDKLSAGRKNMALVVFDSVPAKALTAWDGVMSALSNADAEVPAIEQPS